jgi:maltose alpha-D-glucosyltransferase/alpha-amylase
MNWMERIIRMRKETPEIGWGDFEILHTGTPAVLAIRYDWRDNAVVAVHNLSANFCDVRLSVGLQGDDGLRLVNLLSTDHSVADESGKHSILLEAYGYRWYRAGSLKYLLNRSDG